MRIRRLKDKLGTTAVASGEVEFVDAEAFLLSGEPAVNRRRRRQGPGPDDGADQCGPARHRGMMGLGYARRALVESLCYARRAQAFGDALIDKPLMRRKLAEMIVDVEAAQALVFDGNGVPTIGSRKAPPAHRGAR